MYNKKRIGPKFEPCSTPQLILALRRKSKLLKCIGNALIDNFLTNLILFHLCCIYIVFLLEYCDQMS